MEYRQVWGVFGRDSVHKVFPNYDTFANTKNVEIWSDVIHDLVLDTVSDWSMAGVCYKISTCNILTIILWVMQNWVKASNASFKIIWSEGVNI